MTSGELVVETSGLSKTFGEREAVADLDLAIPRGSVSGFVGPNGAGKTTTIRMLLGLIRPTAGAGTVLGESITRPQNYLDRVGALIEAPAFYPQLTGAANLAALAKLGRVDSSRVPDVLDRVGLGARGTERFRSYSLGMKQRLGIASALLVNPELVVLDEPANGLDPAGILEIRGLIRSLAADDVTVFVSSHLLGEVEQMCDHLVVIGRGRMVYQGSVAELQASTGTRLHARPEDPDQVESLAELVRRAGHPARADQNTVVVEADPDWAGELNRLAMDAGCTLVHLSAERPSLEEAFFGLTGTHSGEVVGAAAMGGVE
jgi:ABC-2 type transport system ATP-binding protein